MTADHSDRAGDRAPAAPFSGGLPEQILRDSQLNYLLGAVPLMTVVSIVNALVVLVLLGGRSSGAIELLWLSGIAVPSLFSLAQHLRRRGRPLVGVGRGKALHAAIRSTYIGAVWGLGSVVFLPGADIPEATFYTFVVGGMIAGLVATLSPLPRHFVGFGLAAMLPTAITLLGRGSRIETGMALLLVLFTLALFVAGFNGYRRFRASLVVKQELASARNLLEDAIESSGEAFAIFDRQGRKLLSNRLYDTLFADRPAPEGPRPEPEVETLPDGRSVLTRIRPTAGGRLVSVHADVSELEAAREEAVGASRAKSMFLAMMSHELRTPLNSIIGFAELLKRADRPPSPDQVRDYAGYVHSSGRHLLGIISDLLDLSRIEAGRYELREEQVDFAVIGEEVLRQIAPLADESEIVLAVEIAGPIHLRADARALRQILLNLLSNAIKFSERGGRVLLRAWSDDDGFTCEVEDLGIGIAEEHLEEIFEPFRQVEDALSRKREGTGLGLPLVRRLAGLHGGEIRLRSRLGEGSCFALCLPAGRVIAPAPESERLEA